MFLPFTACESMYGICNRRHFPRTLSFECDIACNRLNGCIASYYTTLKDTWRTRETVHSAPSAINLSLQLDQCTIKTADIQQLSNNQCPRKSDTFLEIPTTVVSTTELCYHLHELSSPSSSLPPEGPVSHKPTRRLAIPKQSMGM